MPKPCQSYTERKKEPPQIITTWDGLNETQNLQKNEKNYSVANIETIFELSKQFLVFYPPFQGVQILGFWLVNLINVINAATVCCQYGSSFLSRHWRNIGDVEHTIAARGKYEVCFSDFCHKSICFRKGRLLNCPFVMVITFYPVPRQAT